ncbi:MAG TPA: DMT family transporter [Candidatus Limnocylindrales bacterium]|nr:DMT family transporter [Candidatus Limnocylindrales bacterium]
MNHELFIAVIAGLGGMFGWGFSEFATKKAVDRIGTISSLVWAHVLGSIILFLVVLANVYIFKNSFALPTDLYDWLGLIFFGSLQSLVYLFAYKGFEKGKIAILSPIFASFTGWVALLSVLVFGEVLKINLIPALILIFSGVILLNLDPVGWRTKRIRIIGTPGVKEIAIATALAVIWTLGWDKFSEAKDWMLYSFLMFIFMTISAYVISRFNKVDLTKVNSGTWRFLWLIGIGEAVAYLAISLGYASTSFTSVVAILSGASSLPTIILARVFLKEKVAAIQTIGSLIVILGIIFLSIS